ncbi:MAG: Gfo/Idh/MocA family oxidoreductase [Candidatus Bipolaricaulota bacterium]|nr:Gfo/Idh/MocA family oxidoreductase [Candidatus Bipolaricaulota bacterium]MBS3792833.1 Gfo/Idh/MocA family oxidoreductase [Candidatus Bipolaricaulota bacterium]
MVDEVKFGLIGSGFMGKLLASAGDNIPACKLISLADPDEETGKSFAREKEASYYSDYFRMLEEEALDAVIVSTPEYLHREPVVASAERGLDVFVEKPIATNLEDADAIIQAAGKEDVNVMVGYILRFEPAYASIKQAVEEGNAGNIISVYARRNAPIQEAERLNGRLNVVKYIGVHDFDQILWWHPSRPVTVRSRAVEGKVKEKLGTPDFVWTMIEFEDGSFAVVETGWGLPRNWSNWDSPKAWAGFGDVELNVIGSEGVFSLDFTPMDVTGADSDGGWKLPDTRHWPAVDGEVTGAVKTEMERFFRSVHEGTSPPVSAKEARSSLELALAAEKSIEEGRTIKLPLEGSS